MPNYQKGIYDALYDIVGVLSEMQTSIEDHNLWLSRITDQLFDLKDEITLLNKSIKECSPDPDSDSAPAPDSDLPDPDQVDTTFYDHVKNFYS